MGEQSKMRTTTLAPLLLLCFLSLFYQEVDAVCSGCGCNIFCCNCDSACGEDDCGPTGCCEDPITPEDSVKNCCQEKTVGNTTYTLVPGLPDTNAHPTTAKDGCIYTVKGDAAGPRYAFAAGHLPVKCKEDGITTGCPSCCPLCELAECSMPPCIEVNPTTSGPLYSTTNKPVENVVTIVENGETFEQRETYNPDTKEAVFKVPAHGDYLASTILMLGRSSNSPVAGKMMVANDYACSLEDLPDYIIPENIEAKSRRVIDNRQVKSEKIYQVRNEVRAATVEEQENLPENMKSICAGKSIVFSTVETLNEDEFNAKNNIANTFSGNLKRINQADNNTEIIQKDDRQGRRPCRNRFYGCALNSPSSCLYWNYRGLGSTVPQGNNQPLEQSSLHGILGSENYCINCCRDEGTVLMPCSCITTEQAFSTAFQIANNVADYCIYRSNYCKYEGGMQLSGCNYVGGLCVNDGTCPKSDNDCQTQEECYEKYGL